MIIAIRSLTRALSAAAQFANAHPLIVAALFLAIAIGLAVLGAISLVKCSSHRERNTCIIRLPSQVVADLRRDARRCGMRRRAAAAILKVVRAKQAPSRIYLGLSGRWVL